MTTRKTAGTECSMRCKIQKLEDEEPRSYNKPILESILDILRQGRLSDVTFIVGEKKEMVPCHQLFLRARSPVFEVMFSERWNQDTAKEVTLEDVDPEIFRKFLQFIYTDTLEATVPEALELLQLADKFDVQLLVSKCKQLLVSQVTVDDTIAVFQTAKKYDMIQLIDKVGEIWAESLAKLQTLPSFTQLDKETLMYILKRNDLEIKEVDLFRLTLQWAGNQTDASVEENLKDILPLIRFPTMTLNDFTTAVLPTKLLPPSTVIELFTYFGHDDENAKKSLAPALGFSTQERKPKSRILYTELYSPFTENNAVTSMTNRYIQNFKECVQFRSKPQRHLRTYERLEHVQQEPANPATLGFGLSGISVYCPSKTDTTSLSGRDAPVLSFKTFTIDLKAKVSRYWHLNDHDPYGLGTVKLRLPSVQVEEGKITDIDLGTVIPLNTNSIYSVTIEEIAGEERDASVGGYYYANDFGDQKVKIAVSIQNTGFTFLDVRRNQTPEFTQDDHNNIHPRLICRLGFQAL